MHSRYCINFQPDFSLPFLVHILRIDFTYHQKVHADFLQVRWITIAVTKFSRVGHLKNSLNENMAVLVAKDGQEVEEHCGSELVRLIDEEYEHARAD